MPAGGHSRPLVLFGALAMIGSGFLPWWRAGGSAVAGVEVPAIEGGGLEGPGLVVYAAAIAALVVLDIALVRGRWGFALDAGPTYMVIGLVGAAAIAWRAWELWSVGYVPHPYASPGLALAAVGAVVIMFGANRGAQPRRA